MSVAFRRDSDEEHLEPKFDLPIPLGPNLVTRRGLALIEARLTELEARLADAVQEDERKTLLRDARYWCARRTSAQLAPVASGQKVAIGTLVTYQRHEESRTIEIVGHDESDQATNRVSFTAPFVRAMLGSEAGDELDLADGQTLRIIAIAPAPDHSR